MTNFQALFDIARFDHSRFDITWSKEIDQSLYIDQQKENNLNIDKQRNVDLYIDQQKEFEVDS